MGSFLDWGQARHPQVCTSKGVSDNGSERMSQYVKTASAHAPMDHAPTSASRFREPVPFPFRFQGFDTHAGLIAIPGSQTVPRETTLFSLHKHWICMSLAMIWCCQGVA
jgi:hypothetical protein